MRPIVRIRPTASVVALLVCCLAVAPADARKPGRAEAKASTVRLENWLRLGPVDQPLPVFHDERRGGFRPERLLDADFFDTPPTRPVAGETVGWFDDASLVWEPVGTGAGGDVTLDAGEGPAVAWLGAYVSARAWTHARLEVTGSQPLAVWVDGESVGRSTAAGKDDLDPVETEVKWIPGRHFVLVRTVRDPGRATPWNVRAELSPASQEVRLDVQTGTERTRSVELRDVIESPNIVSMAAGPGGVRFVTISRTPVPGTEQVQYRLEVRSSANGRLIQTLRFDAPMSDVSWAPGARFISFLVDQPDSAGEADKGGRKSLYLLENGKNNVQPLLRDVAGLVGYRWQPNAKAIVYWTTERSEPDERGVKRVESLMDRWATFRHKQYLHRVSVPDGVRTQLTAGAASTTFHDISDNSQLLLFSRQIEDLARRPYSRQELWQMDLTTGQAVKLREFEWLNQALYSPDAQRILVSAPPTEFERRGTRLAAESIPNSYDSQLYVWDPGSGEVDPITLDFDPAVSWAEWNRRDKFIYLTAQDGSRDRLYRYDPETREFTALNTGFENLEQVSFAHNAPISLVRGSSPWKPWGMTRVPLDERETTNLAHPANAWFRGVNMGSVEDWSFAASSGKTIPGRVYLPPDFDAERKYPAIVHYYGGTSPVGRGFAGRYPKEWWAANGYVVYVPQPSGATGFGQAWSAEHVNDWGKTTAGEIIEGTRKFLEAHPYVDPARVGCIGASYGGFMTMLLVSQTDLFATAVSHAGISSLSSYWGEGYWGYAYSSVATADSFPWNRRDLYVEQSPLFRADRVNTPILLTHGRADTNVPVGESDQFFVALKLLGKTVEYVQVEGQDHWIVDPDKRRVWSQTILAWFDRWLKDRPEWWNALYPDPETAAAATGAK